MLWIHDGNARWPSSEVPGGSRLAGSMRQVADAPRQAARARLDSLNERQSS